MIQYEKFNNEYTDQIDCPGTEKHYRLTSSGDSSSVDWCIMIEPYLPLIDQIKSMPVYQDDVWVITFPKCGTTWTQEMVWLLNNDLNYDRASKETLEERFPFLELTGALTLIGGDSVEKVRDLKRPRHIKSHLPFMLLPEAIHTVRPKVIYVSRNPKDAATSFFHHYRNIVGFDGAREQFFDAFLNESHIYAPFSGHVRRYWEWSQNPTANCLFLTYEQMKRDLRAVIEKTANFLGKQYSLDAVAELSKHLSVESMRNNKSCNMDDLLEWARATNYSEERKKRVDNGFRFIRSGNVGTYKQDMSDEYIERFEKYEQRITKESGFDFYF